MALVGESLEDCFSVCENGRWLYGCTSLESVGASFVGNLVLTGKALKVEFSSVLSVFPLNRPQSPSAPGVSFCAIRNETYFPMCFLSFLIKISKAYLSVAETESCGKGYFLTGTRPRVVPHSSRGGGRLMAGHVQGTATDWNQTTASCEGEFNHSHPILAHSDRASPPVCRLK